MRFYKNSEEFVDYFSFTGGGIEDGGVNTDVKDGDEEDNFSPMISEEVEGGNEKICVKVNKNQDIIESIDVECKCGNKVRIIIDYND